tara:strand:+ start:155 stop:676 length:522 start_codon:yes stop_codon:yes gene_type:complete
MKNIYTMRNLLNILGALLLSITIISCGSESENSTEKTETPLDFSIMKISIDAKLSDYIVEEDGIFHNAMIDNKSVRLSVELADNETIIQELVNNLQENKSSIKRTENSELSANKNANGSDYKLTTEVNLIVGADIHNAILYYNAEINNLNGLLEINIDGTEIYMIFKGKKERK